MIQDILAAMTKSWRPAYRAVLAMRCDTQDIQQALVFSYRTEMPYAGVIWC